MNVRRCEAKKPVPRVDERVLAAVVFDQALPMIAAVVLENKPRLWVIQVDPAHEPSRAVS